MSVDPMRGNCPSYCELRSDVPLFEHSLTFHNTLIILHPMRCRVVCTCSRCFFGLINCGKGGC